MASHPNHFASGDVLYGDCADGVDNDADGLADYPADTECASPDDSTEGPAFVPGWGSALSLRYTYAVATQVVNGLSFVAAPGAALGQISDFAEPEQTPEGAPPKVFSGDELAAAVLGTELVLLASGPSLAATEGWLIHLGSGATRAWSFGAPARRAPQLAPGAQPGTLVLVGGRDMQNIPHDDIWVLRPGMHQAEMIIPDSADSAAFDRRIAIVPPEAWLPGAAFSLSPGGELIRRIRDVGGWHDAACPSPQVRGFAAFGLQALAVLEGATVEGGPIGTSSGPTLVATGADVEAIVTAADLSLAQGAAALGGLVAGAATLHPTATIATAIDDGLGFALPSFDCARPSPRLPSAADVLVPQGTSLTLPPGDYGTVQLETTGTLHLSTGTYRLRGLIVPPGAQLVLSSSSGLTRVETETILDLRGMMPSPDESPRLLWIHGGTAPTTVAGLVGTLVAPRSSVRVSGDSRGAVFARQVQLAEGARLVHQPLLGGWR